jgi:hypothetical protein
MTDDGWVGGLYHRSKHWAVLPVAVFDFFPEHRRESPSPSSASSERGDRTTGDPIPAVTIDLASQFIQSGEAHAVAPPCGQGRPVSYRTCRLANRRIPLGVPYPFTHPPLGGATEEATT